MAEFARNVGRQRSEVQGLCDLESELLVPSPLDPAAQLPTPESTLPGFSWPPLSDPKDRASIGENGAWMSPPWADFTPPHSPASEELES